MEADATREDALDELRDEYPGHEDEIDRIVGRHLGNPAQMREELEEFARERDYAEAHGTGDDTGFGGDWADRLGIPELDGSGLDVPGIIDRALGVLGGGMGMGYGGSYGGYDDGGSFDAYGDEGYGDLYGDVGYEATYEDLAGAAVPSEPAAVPVNPLPAQTEATAAKTIVILNPEANAQNVAFLLDDQQHSLKTGEQFAFETLETIIIQFDKGDGAGTEKFSLTEGVFEFRRAEDGWGFVRRPFKVILDNPADSRAFSYQADGEAFVLEAGMSKTHESRFPVVISLDPGTGETVQVPLPSGTYKIGTDPETNYWDLFPVPQDNELATQ